MSTSGYQQLFETLLLKTGRWPLAILISVCIAGFLQSCSSHATEKQKDAREIQAEKNSYNDGLLNEAKSLIRNGDLLLRGGKDFSSRFVKEINKKDRAYSHGGIALVKEGEVYVYHIIPDHTQTNDKIRFDKIDSFLVAYDNTDFAIARYKIDSSETIHFLSYLQQLYEQKVAFDMAFDLRSDERMYCSEMIAKGLKKATENRVVIKTDLLNDKSKFKLIRMYYKVPEASFINTEIIPVDHLFLNEYCTVIKRFSYQQ
jgi:Permuted papain-like amidase enzyme, YaeF/YiiX, C92 family